METDEKEKGDLLWIIVGFVFAFLGGLIGVLFGINYIKANYDKQTKTLGWIMLTIAACMSSYYMQKLKNFGN